MESLEKQKMSSIRGEEMSIRLFAFLGPCVKMAVSSSQKTDLHDFIISIMLTKRELREVAT